MRDIQLYHTFAICYGVLQSCKGCGDACALLWRIYGLPIIDTALLLLR